MTLQQFGKKMSNVQFSMFNDYSNLEKKCPMFNFQCSIFTAIWKKNVQCSIFHVQCVMFNVQCSNFHFSIFWWFRVKFVTRNYYCMGKNVWFAILSEKKK